MPRLLFGLAGFLVVAAAVSFILERRQQRSMTQNSTPIAELTWKQDDVRRRGAEAIHFERMFEQGKFFMRDTVFVGEASAATLNLFDQGKLQLGANTILVLNGQVGATASQNLVELNLLNGDVEILDAVRDTRIQLAHGKSLILEKGSSATIRSGAKTQAVALKKGRARVEKITEPVRLPSASPPANDSPQNDSLQSDPPKDDGSDIGQLVSESDPQAQFPEVTVIEVKDVEVEKKEVAFVEIDRVEPEAPVTVKEKVPIQEVVQKLSSDAQLQVPTVRDPEPEAAPPVPPLEIQRKPAAKPEAPPVPPMQQPVPPVQQPLPQMAIPPPTPPPPVTSTPEPQKPKPKKPELKKIEPQKVQSKEVQPVVPVRAPVIRKQKTVEQVEQEAQQLRREKERREAEERAAKRRLEDEIRARELAEQQRLEMEAAEKHARRLAAEQAAQEAGSGVVRRELAPESDTVLSYYDPVRKRQVWILAAMGWMKQDYNTTGSVSGEGGQGQTLPGRFSIGGWWKQWIWGAQYRRSMGVLSPIGTNPVWTNVFGGYLFGPGRLWGMHGEFSAVANFEQYTNSVTSNDASFAFVREATALGMGVDGRLTLHPRWQVGSSFLYWNYHEAGYHFMFGADVQFYLASSLYWGLGWMWEQSEITRGGGFNERSQTVESYLKYQF